MMLRYSFDLDKEADEIEKAVKAVLWNVTHTYCLYDRHSGEDYSFGSCLSSLAAAKAQVTRMERRIREYTTWQKQNNLFFDEQTDEMLQKAVTKLKIKKENVQEAERRLQRKAEKHQREMRK